MVVALIAHRRFPGEWYEVVDAAAWLALLSGGISLVRADKLPRPVASEAAPRPAAPHADIRRLDRAYGTFALIAIAIVGLGLASNLGPEAQAWGMIIGPPLGLAILGLCIAGLVYSVKCFREWPLPVMFEIVVTVPIVASTYDQAVAHMGTLVGTWIAIAVAALFFFCARWFGILRKRRMRTTS